MASQHLQHLTSPLSFAHQLMRSAAQVGDTVVDATMGNGYDTLLLAQQVGSQGQVIAFDIQQQALEHTTQRLIAHNAYTQTRLLAVGHEHMDKYIPKDISLIVFNLGYLPGANKSCTTQVSTTLRALEIAHQHLKLNGLLLIMVYPGHEEGKKEAEAIYQWTKGLDQSHYQVLRYGFINQKNHPPFLLAIERTT